MKMKTIIASVSLSALLFTSCKKDAANTESASPFTYRLQTTNRSTTIARTEAAGRTVGANIQWTAGTASADELKFEAKSSSNKVEYKQHTTQQIDLFAASSVLGNVTIPAGTYSEVEFKAHLSPAASTPALQLSGSFTSGGVTKAIQFVVGTNVELKAEKNNVTVAQGTNYSALNTIDLSELTSGVTESALRAAAVSGNTVIISASSNADIYNIMLNNLHSHHCEAEVEHD